MDERKYRNKNADLIDDVRGCKHIQQIGVLICNILEGHFFRHNPAGWQPFTDRFDALCPPAFEAFPEIVTTP